MFDAIARILRTICLVPPSKSGPAGRRPPDSDEATAPTLPVGAFANDAPAHGDDRRGDVRTVEPAMAGMLTHTDQWTPPAAASPGLLPVDPVKVDAETAGTTPPGRGPTRKGRPSRKQALSDGLERGEHDVTSNLS